MLQHRVDEVSALAEECHMMMTREQMLKRVDELLDTYQPYTADNLSWLGLQLEKLLDGEAGPCAPRTERGRNRHEDASGHPHYISYLPALISE